MVKICTRLGANHPHSGHMQRSTFNHVTSGTGVGGVYDTVQSQKLSPRSLGTQVAGCVAHVQAIPVAGMGRGEGAGPGLHPHPAQQQQHLAFSRNSAWDRVVVYNLDKWSISSFFFWMSRRSRSTICARRDEGRGAQGPRECRCSRSGSHANPFGAFLRSAGTAPDGDLAFP